MGWGRLTRFRPTTRKTRTPRTALAACAVSAAAFALLPASVSATGSPACTPQALQATFTVLPFSEGAGNISYNLTVTNRSGNRCHFQLPLHGRLIGRRGGFLPSNVTSRGGTYTIGLGPHEWARASTRFSPDVDGKGETGQPCEPVATRLRLSFGRIALTAAMDPTPVCEHGRISLSRFVVPAGSARPCPTGDLIASFKPFARGSYTYILAFRNLGAVPCYVRAIPALQLLDGAGRRLATHEVAGVQSPYVIPPGAVRAATASLFQHGGRCDAPAKRVIARFRVGASLTIPVQGRLRACRSGRIELTGLYRP